MTKLPKKKEKRKKKSLVMWAGSYPIGISDTQRYKCLGNAVTVNVIEAIMERLL